jgi:hypothetical protein
MMNARMRILACTAFLVCGAERAHAQGLAVRGGANVNPDQVYGGAHYDTRLMDRVCSTRAQTSAWAMARRSLPSVNAACRRP